MATIAPSRRPRTISPPRTDLLQQSVSGVWAAGYDTEHLVALGKKRQAVSIELTHRRVRGRLLLGDSIPSHTSGTCTRKVVRQGTSGPLPTAENVGKQDDSLLRDVFHLRQRCRAIH